MFFDQTCYDVRCEWGPEGVAALAPVSDVVVVVDVLSFTTSVEVATRRGATVYPYRWKDETAHAFAASVGAEVADESNARGFGLSPSTLLELPSGARLVLPSPNGSTVSLLAGRTPVVAGCLRNARAVARWATRAGGRVSVIPAGERWADGTLRPCVEDLLGAGTIISHLTGRPSPEASAARAAFDALSHDLRAGLEGCASGREKVERGEAEDVRIAAELDVSDCVPVLKEGAFVRES